MAALDLPWIDSMSAPSYTSEDVPSASQPSLHDPAPPTVAAFSPTNISGSSLASKQRSTIIVHRKSPLLVATPPAVTRALAYSHPFILPLTRLVGLITWTTGDPWQSFLLVAGFWSVVLYGDVIIQWAGPVLVVVGLILGMYSRRYSPLSSTGLTGEKHGHKRQVSEGSMRHHKSLDEIVETLRTFTTRCNIMLEPLLELTDFLSTQRTATSATTRPALMALLARILLVTPVWILLTLRPFRIITTQRVTLIVGTIILTWHSRPARVSRVILWRSLTVRKILTFITGLPFSSEKPKSGTGSAKNQQGHATSISTKGRSGSAGVRFTFIVYENQRRWLGIGWTYSLFPNERAPWTDEHLNAVPPKDEFELPEVQGGNAIWRWVDGSEWRTEGASDDSSVDKHGKKKDSKGSDNGGWIFYDNKWNDGRRGQDGWGRYTRRRKWYRDAELVEVSAEPEATQASQSKNGASEKNVSISTTSEQADQETKPTTPNTRRRRWFGSSSVDLSSSKNLSSSAPTATTSAINIPNNTSSGRAAGGTRPASVKSNRSSTGLSTSGPKRPTSFVSRRSSGTAVSWKMGADSASGRDSDTLSVREKEVEQAQDRLDLWGTRAGVGTERAEREFGLGDDANMGLS